MKCSSLFLELQSTYTVSVQDGRATFSAEHSAHAFSALISEQGLDGGSHSSLSNRFITLMARACAEAGGGWRPPPLLGTHRRRLQNTQVSAHLRFSLLNEGVEP